MPSRDTGRIVLGLVIFLVLVSFPIWYTATQRPVGLPARSWSTRQGETQCVESKEYMRAWHMDLLNEWRDSVVREGVRTYTSEADHHRVRHEPAEHLHEVPPEQGDVLRPVPQLRRRQSRAAGTATSNRREELSDGTRVEEAS